DLRDRRCDAACVDGLADQLRRRNRSLVEALDGLGVSGLDDFPDAIGIRHALRTPDKQGCGIVEVVRKFRASSVELHLALAIAIGPVAPCHSVNWRPRNL